MKNVIFSILAIVQIVLWILLLASALFPQVGAAVKFDPDNPSQWYGVTNSDAYVSTSEDAPAQPPTVTTTIINRTSH